MRYKSPTDASTNQQRNVSMATDNRFQQGQLVRVIDGNYEGTIVGKNITRKGILYDVEVDGERGQVPAKALAKITAPVIEPEEDEIGEDNDE